MGNFSSCTSAGFNSAAEASPSPLAHTPPHVARVLLVDGSMLKFRAPIKVIQLLLDYPNHLICPLDSLKPGLHSLSSLLPDEKLQLDSLYLLLPFKGNLQESCAIKSKHVMQQKREELLDMQERRERTRLLPGDKSNVGIASCANFYKKGDGGLYDKKLQSSSLVQEEHISKKKAGISRDTGKWQQKNHVKMVKSEVGFQDCAETSWKNGDVGLADSGRRSATCNSYCKLSEKRKGRREMRGYSAKESNEKEGSNVICPLCDTPELQRAYLLDPTPSAYS